MRSGIARRVGVAAAREPKTQYRSAESLDGMTKIAPYYKRPARLIRRECPHGWRLKLYGLALPGHEPRVELVEAASAAAAAVLPRPALAEDRYGTGCAIAHDANGAYFARALDGEV